MDSRKNNISKAILFGVGVGSTIADYKPLYLEYCAIGKNEILLLGLQGIYLSKPAPPISMFYISTLLQQATFDISIFKHGSEAFRVKSANISSFFCPSIPKRDLDKKKTTPNIEV